MCQRLPSQNCGKHKIFPDENVYASVPSLVFPMHLRIFFAKPIEVEQGRLPHRRPSARTSRPLLLDFFLLSGRRITMGWAGAVAARVFMSRKTCLPTCAGGSMSATIKAAPSASSSTNAIQLDALIIGAGIAGIYQLYRLREQGLSVRGLEAGDNLGGTWYWNRYPGARVDSQSHVYQYWFSRELNDEWDWSERFPAQPEVERYLNHVADRFDLRKDIQFNTRVTAAIYDEAAKRWSITTQKGERLQAQYLISCAGMLSEPLSALFAGQDEFKGRIFHTARWPKESIDFTGKKVGVIGTAATGIQVIQTIASQVAHLKVFQRTPQYAIPMNNPKLTDADRASYKNGSTSCATA